MDKKIVPLLTVLFALIVFVAFGPVMPSMHVNAATLSAQAPSQQNPNSTTQQPTQPPDQSQTANPNQNPNQNPTNPPTQHHRLPKTGSELPLMGLIGLISIVGIIVVRRISRTIS